MLAFANVALLLAAAWWLSGAGRAEAESLEREIASMPGVVATNLAYMGSILERRDVLLDVVLAPQVTESQAVAVGTAFVDRLNRRFDQYSAHLNLRYPATPHPSPYVPDFSQASFWYNPAEAVAPPDAHKVADSIALWLRAVGSPATAHASLTQSMGSTRLIRYVDLTLRDDANAVQVETLDDDIGDRAKVTWRFVPVADDTHRPHEYKATPAPPIAALKAMFNEISGVVDAADRLEVWTSASDSAKYADTSVTIEIARGPDKVERTIRSAESVGEVLSRFGTEVTLTVYGHQTAEVVVGGCYFREGQTSNSDLERHLSGMFETC